MQIVELPKPRFKGNISVEEAILLRRSVRRFSSKKLSLDQISQILWSAQGITRKNFFRTVPSAGALYPIEIYAVLESGVYLYMPKQHAMRLIREGDRRRELAVASLSQNFIAEAPLVIVIAAVFERTMSRYGRRGIRYVYMEAGHVSQNIYLQCVSLGLATVAVGAFYDDEVKEVLSMQEDHEPLYIMPIGYEL